MAVLRWAKNKGSMSLSSLTIGSIQIIRIRHVQVYCMASPDHDGRILLLLQIEEIRLVHCTSPISHDKHFWKIKFLVIFLFRTLNFLETMSTRQEKEYLRPDVLPTIVVTSRVFFCRSSFGLVFSTLHRQSPSCICVSVGIRNHFSSLLDIDSHFVSQCWLKEAVHWFPA